VKRTFDFRNNYFFVILKIMLRPLQKHIVFYNYETSSHHNQVNLIAQDRCKRWLFVMFF